MDEITKGWLEGALSILKNSSSRHKLQDGHYWFICPEETIDHVIIRAINMALSHESDVKQEPEKKIVNLCKQCGDIFCKSNGTTCFESMDQCNDYQPAKNVNA
jgi:hypothetical protein